MCSYSDSTSMMNNVPFNLRNSYVYTDNVDDVVNIPSSIPPPPSALTSAAVNESDLQYIMHESHFPHAHQALISSSSSAQTLQLTEAGDDDGKNEEERNAGEEGDREAEAEHDINNQEQQSEHCNNDADDAEEGHAYISIADTMNRHTNRWGGGDGVGVDVTTNVLGDRTNDSRGGEHPAMVGAREIREENENLERYATKLSTLSQLLDSRSANLQRAEHELSEEKQLVQTQQRKLSSVEQTTREHINDLLNDILQKQSQLNKKEVSINETKQLLDKKFQDAKLILNNVCKINNQLLKKQKMLNNLKLKCSQYDQFLRDSKLQLSDLKLKDSNIHKNSEQLLKNKMKLNDATVKLQGLFQQLQQKETTLVQSEKEVQNRLAKVERFEQLERMLNPLQMLLDQICTLNVRNDDDCQESTQALTPDIKSNIEYGVQFALVKVNEVTTEVQKLNTLKKVMEEKEEKLNHREIGLNKLDQSVKQRQVQISLEERQVRQLKQNNDRITAEINQKENQLEEVKCRLEKKEEELKLQQDEILFKRDEINRKQLNIKNLEQTLLRKENSIIRALAAIEARERNVENKEKFLQEERNSIYDLRKEIELKQGLIHTKELELTARVVGANNTVNNHESVNNNNNNGGTIFMHINENETGEDLHSPSKTNTNPIASATATTTINNSNNNHDNGGAMPYPFSSQVGVRDSISAEQSTQQPQTSTGTPNRFETNAQPTGTIRRQLAFESTAKNRVSNVHFNTNATTINRGSINIAGTSSAAAGRDAYDTEQEPLPTAMQQGDEDDESEAAAEQLLPELMSARELWRERIERVLQVIGSMRETSLTERPHLETTLTSVRQKLQTLLSEVSENDSLNVHETSTISSNTEAYSRERELQVKWSQVLKEQLETVKEIQTGLLIGIQSTGNDADEESTSAASSATTQSKNSFSVPFNQGMGMKSNNLREKHVGFRLDNDGHNEADVDGLGDRNDVIDSFDENLLDDLNENITRLQGLDVNEEKSGSTSALDNLFETGHLDDATVTLDSDHAWVGTIGDNTNNGSNFSGGSNSLVDATLDATTTSDQSFTVDTGTLTRPIDSFQNVVLHRSNELDGPLFPYSLSEINSISLAPGVADVNRSLLRSTNGTRITQRGQRSRQSEGGTQVGEGDIRNDTSQGIMQSYPSNLLGEIAQLQSDLQSITGTVDGISET